MESYIQFKELEPNPKTRRWSVLTLDEEPLGRVSWHGAWRCYAFFPDSDTVFETACLTELTGFLKARTAEYRAAKLGAANPCRNRGFAGVSPLRARDTGYSRRHGCGSPGMLHSRMKVHPALSEVR